MLIISISSRLTSLPCNIENEYNPNSIDFRYIFGKVDYITVTDGGMLLNYIYEYVHSPFFEDRVPGFSMEYTAVVRDYIIKKMYGADFEQIKDHTLIHEILHTISYSFRLGSPFTSANWNLYVSRDICRFLRQSRTIAEINKVFRLYKENVFEKLLGKYTDNYEKIKAHKEPFEEIFASLVTRGIIVKNGDKYFCKKYEEKNEWTLL